MNGKLLLAAVFAASLAACTSAPIRTGLATSPITEAFDAVFRDPQTESARNWATYAVDTIWTRTGGQINQRYSTASFQESGASLRRDTRFVRLQFEKSQSGAIEIWIAKRIVISQREAEAISRWAESAGAAISAAADLTRANRVHGVKLRLFLTDNRGAVDHRYPASPQQPFTFVYRVSDIIKPDGGVPLLKAARVIFHEAYHISWGLSP